MFGFGGKVKRTKNGVEARKRNVKIEISRSGIKGYVKTGHVFLDKITNGLSNNSPFYVNIESRGLKEKIVEDAGFAIGLGLKKLSEDRGKDHASYIHSDGKGMCMFSLDISSEMRGSTIQVIGKPKEFDPKDLFAFFDSISQGMESEIKGVLNLGKKKTDEINFVSKAFAGSLKQMFG